MKKLLIIITGLFILASASAQFTKANLQATGLTCAMCSNAINKSLEKLPFISSVRSDIKNSSFRITFREGAEMEIDQIRKAVEDAGFGIGSLQITGAFNNVNVENDKHVRIGDRNFHFLNIKSQVLEGEKTITVVDRDFLSAKQFKKYMGSTKMSCVSSGRAAPCCEGVEHNSRIYHVTI